MFPGHLRWVPPVTGVTNGCRSREAEMTLDPQAPGQSTAAVGTAEQRSQIRKAALASTVGTTIEWYDFFLYNTAAALIFPALFFPESSTYAGQLESFATYAVGFAARPVGAFIFGHYGDRIGRKATLIITLLMMGLATTLVGVLPGADSIGKAAPLLLVLLRLLQGIAVGGEWSGSVLLSMEWGDQKRRGFMASLPQLGVAFGLIIGTGFLYLMSWVAHRRAVRVVGLADPVPVQPGDGGDRSLHPAADPRDPDVRQAAEGEEHQPDPSLEVWKEHWKPIVLSALARMSEQAPFYVITAFTLTYLTEEEGYTKTFALAAILSAAAVELVAVPLFGHLSDTIGRKKMYMTGAALRASTPSSSSPPWTAGSLHRVLRDADRADPARHAVRAAGRAHRRVVPDVAALRRRRTRLPDGLGDRGRSGAAGGDVPAEGDRLGVLDRRGRLRLRGDHAHRGVVDGRPEPLRHHRRRDVRQEVAWR